MSNLHTPLLVTLGLGIIHLAVACGEAGAKGDRGGSGFSGASGSEGLDGGTAGTGGSEAVGSGGALPIAGAGGVGAAAPQDAGGKSSAGTGAGGSSGHDGASGDAGSGAQRTDTPIDLCGSPTLAGLIYCSAEEACKALDCGAPWSLYDAEGCRRQECSFDGVCPTGARCVPAIVTGNFSQDCFSDFDSCEDSSGTCTCASYGCYPISVCLPAEDFPQEGECPIQDLDCDALQLAARNVFAYLQSQYEIESGTLPPALRATVDRCRERIEAAYEKCR